ncbi:AraC family transcriptional regulator [Kiritimatiella glycovorans]|uniref:AraC family transcriptional regulator n=2 Tax=Kiritimatiella glycovorans TaxID=1307763 RepID=A0A0G3EK04_9BACT|nr:AraC family transcriptional regulator [Kiritimatiella glycovorans]
MREAEGRLPYVEQPSCSGWRQTYAGDDTQCPFIPHLGRVRYGVALTELPHHIHKDCFELAGIISGHLHWELGGREYVLHPGDCFLTLPGEVHGGCRSVMEPGELFFVQIDAIRAGRDEEMRKLLDRLFEFEARKFPGCTQIVALLERMMHVCEHPKWHARLLQRSRLTLLLAETIECAGRSDDRPALTPPVHRALRYLDEHLCEGVVVADLRHASRLSRSEFFRRFKLETGERPHEMLLRRKLELACDHLTGTAWRITDIAHELGFSSSQYFATVFKKYTGTTPRRYRAELKGHKGAQGGGSG